MNLRGLIILSIGVMLAMAGFAYVTLLRLPPDAQLPIHWNGAGQVDRTAPAHVSLFMPIGVLALITLLFAVIPSLEPLQQRMEKSAPLYRVTWLSLLAVMAMVQLAVALPAYGLHHLGILPVAGVGLFFVVLGNALPKSRPSFFVGIRTPWTLADPENWIATHRLGGRTMMAGGLMLMVTPALPVSLRIGWTFLAIAVMIVPPLVYSWWYWRRRGRQQS